MARPARARKQAPQAQTAARRAAAEPPFRDVSVDWRTGAWALGIFLVVFAVYALTAARDIIIGDTAEFVTVAVTFGVAHPSGYPLLVLLGHLFSLIPVGPLPFRVDLLAAVSGAGAATFTFLIARQFGAGAIASAIAAFTLASHPLFWEWSLVLEAFPLNNLIVAATLYFLFRWEGQPASGRNLVIAALLAGLGASNHQTIVFVIPAILAVLWRRRSFLFRDVKLVATCLGAAAMGFLPYATIPWAESRHPFISWGSISSFGDLMDHFLRKAYGTANLAAPGDDVGPPWPRLMLLARSFSYLQIVLLPLGAVDAYRRRRWYFWSALTVFAIAGPLFVVAANISVQNVGSQWILQRFFLLPHVVLAPLAAFGVIYLSELVSRYITRGRLQLAASGVAVVAAGVILFGAVRAYPQLDQSQNHTAHNYAEDILASLPQRAILLAAGDDVVLPVAYLQAVEHQRPDVTLVMLGILKGYAGLWYIPQLRRHDPTLVVPFDLYNRQSPKNTIKALVDANPGRQFALIGDALDDSMTKTHWFYRHGLVQEYLPMEVDVTLNTASSEADRLLKVFHLPDPKTVKYFTFESGMLANYAMTAKAVGDEYATAGMKDEAAQWYRRSLEIFPTLIQTQEALKKVSK